MLDTSETQANNVLELSGKHSKLWENLHVNFTIVLYSSTNITSLFYPVSKFLYFCICDTPLNCYYFTHQSHPFALLMSLRRITKFTI